MDWEVGHTAAVVSDNHRCSAGIIRCVSGGEFVWDDNHLNLDDDTRDVIIAAARDRKDRVGTGGDIYTLSYLPRVTS